MQYVYFETERGDAYIIPDDRMIMRSDSVSFSINASSQLFTAIVMDSICYFSDSEKALLHLRARAAERAGEMKGDASIAEEVPAPAWQENLFASLPKRR